MISIPNVIVLTLHLFICIGANSFLFFYLLDKFGKNEIGHESIGYLIFGIIGIVFLFLLMRFFKIIVCKKEKIFLIYPFLFWIKIFNKKDLLTYNTSQMQMIRFACEYRFTIIRTSSNDEFIISDFMYFNYAALREKLIKSSVKWDENLQIMKVKHLYILISIFVVLLLGVALLSQ